MNSTAQQLINERLTRLNMISGERMAQELRQAIWDNAMFIYPPSKIDKRAIYDNKETDKWMLEFESRSYVNYCIDKELPF